MTDKAQMVLAMIGMFGSGLGLILFLHWRDRIDRRKDAAKRDENMGDGLNDAF